MAMDNFTPGKQIVNKIPKIRYYLSQKDIFAQALKRFDQKQIYNFDSSEFHLKAFHFNLNEPIYNKQEKKFMEEINEGFWITKDPLGQNGYGITVFKDVQVLKEKIQYIKQQSASQNNSEENNTELIKDEGNEKIQIIQQKEEGENYIDNKLNLNSNNQFAYVEEYMHNPFLWDNKKIDHRSFLLIASLNPLVVLYQDGFVKRCIDEYDNNFEEFDTQAIFKHITNRKQYKGKHPNYNKLEDELILTIPQLQDYMRKNHNFTDEQFENLQHQKHKMMAYCIMAVRDKLDPIQGAYTLLGFDFIWDENFKLKIIEINTVPELSGKLSAQKYVYPKLIQSTLDLIIDTLQEPSKTWEKWKNPNNLELRNWEIIINEAQNFNVLDQYKIKN